jgi:hypothetical protein
LYSGNWQNLAIAKALVLQAWQLNVIFSCDLVQPYLTFYAISMLFCDVYRMTVAKVSLKSGGFRFISQSAGNCYVSVISAKNVQ